MQAILAAGAPVSTPDVHGGYPLHYAAQMCGGVSVLKSFRPVKADYEMMPGSFNLVPLCELKKNMLKILFENLMKGFFKLIILQCLN